MAAISSDSAVLEINSERIAVQPASVTELSALVAIEQERVALPAGIAVVLGERLSVRL